MRTIKLHKVVLSLVFKNAIRDGILSSNPCDYARIPKKENEVSSATFCTVEQCKELLKCAEGTVLHDMIYITMLYGLRRSELMGLKWDAVDFKKNTIAIKHTVVVQNTVIAKDKTKNKTSMRTYPLLDEVKEILVKIKSTQEENKKIFGNCYEQNDYIFTKEDGSTYYPTYPSHEL